MPVFIRDPGLQFSFLEMSLSHFSVSVIELIE